MNYKLNTSIIENFNSVALKTIEIAIVLSMKIKNQL